jgi:deazaflavin-dependent oxidoreductase (nitroreductase family)
MPHTTKLRYIDPYQRRGRLYRGVCRFSTTKAGTWLAVNIAWKLDPHLLKLTRGRFSTAAPVAAALLETRGARTGRTRRNATLYFHDGDRVTLVAALRGWPKDPAWYYNLRKHPDVVFGGLPFRAEIVEDEAERERLFGVLRVDAVSELPFREEAGRAGRVIPLIQLVPCSP